MVVLCIEKTHFTSLLFSCSPSTQTLQTHQSITCRAGARTWAFISLRTNKSQSVDTRALFCSPAIIHRVQFPLTGCQRPPVFIITKWWEVERKTSFHKEVDGKVKERNKIMKKIKNTRSCVPGFTKTICWPIKHKSIWRNFEKLSQNIL